MTEKKKFPDSWFEVRGRILKAPPEYHVLKARKDKEYKEQKEREERYKND